MGITTPSPDTRLEARILESLDRPLLQRLLVAAVVLVQLATLWQSDLHTWDEALYAQRVLAIVAHGLWLDQTALAESGLWSSSHPPALIWAMAASALAFGFDEVSVRLPSLLSALGICVLLHRLACSLSGDRRLGWLALLVYLSVPLISEVTRRAQLDGGVLFFMTLSLYLFATPDPTRVSMQRALLSGVALGLGLMSKLVVAAFVPLTLLVFLVWQQLRGEPGTGRVWLAWLLHGSVGAAIALPWLAFMAVSHGSPYWEQAWGFHVVERMVRPLEGHTSAFGLLHWPLQTVANMGPVAPFVVVGLALWQPAQSALRRLALCWLAVPFAIFCLTATRNESYFLMFALPLVYFATVGLHAFLDGRVPPARAAWTAAGALVALLWQECDPLRSALAELPARAGGPVALALLGLGAGLGVIAPGRHRRTLVLAALVTLALNATYRSAQLLEPQEPEWQGVRAQLAAAPAGSTLALLEVPTLKDRLYARLVAFDAWSRRRGASDGPARACAVTQNEALASRLTSRYPAQSQHGDLLLLCGSSPGQWRGASLR